MAEKSSDERVSIPLEPEQALRGLLKVDPESVPAEGRDPAKRVADDAAENSAARNAS